ncbi:hypothetical protein NIES4071_00820 [Calothrix sp. NIES-4071]|nr:hypothetical protein NIES4071_00820 [Calothrix sp. NIES-4071]BAZ54428.1 hypothetical protein NIES4105_00810 [Calothrix sp. NIES-4105]
MKIFSNLFAISLAFFPTAVLAANEYTFSPTPNNGVTVGITSDKTFYIKNLAPSNNYEIRIFPLPTGTPRFRVEQNPATPVNVNKSSQYWRIFSKSDSCSQMNLARFSDLNFGAVYNSNNTIVTGGSNNFNIYMIQIFSTQNGTPTLKAAFTNLQILSLIAPNGETPAGALSPCP